MPDIDPHEALMCRAQPQLRQYFHAEVGHAEGFRCVDGVV